MIAQHQNLLISKKYKINYSLLSNDNGFLSYYPHYFTQRTLLARIQMNNTNPKHTLFIRKPVYSMMALLSLLGEVQVQTSVVDVDGKLVGNYSNFGSVASVHVPDLVSGQDRYKQSRSLFILEKYVVLKLQIIFFVIRFA